MKIKRTHTTITRDISMTVEGIDSFEAFDYLLRRPKKENFCGCCCKQVGIEQCFRRSTTLMIVLVSI